MELYLCYLATNFPHRNDTVEEKENHTADIWAF